MYSKDELANIAADQYEAEDQYADDNTMIDIDDDFYDDSDDAYALASGGFGTDEDYNSYSYDY